MGTNRNAKPCCSRLVNTLKISEFSVSKRRCSVFEVDHFLRSSAVGNFENNYKSRWFIVIQHDSMRQELLLVRGKVICGAYGIRKVVCCRVADITAERLHYEIG